MKRELLIITAALFFVSALKIYSQNVLSEKFYDKEYAVVVPGELSGEDEEKYLKKLSPEARAKLEEIKKLNKNKYYQLLRGSSSNLLIRSSGGLSNFYETIARSYTDKKESENVLAQKHREAEIDVELLVLKYPKADASTQQKLRTELYNALGKLFDVRESFKQEEIKELEKRLQDLKESLNTRKQNRDNIVSRRLKELLNEKDELKW